MKTYKVLLTETTTRGIYVRASNEDAACDLAVDIPSEHWFVEDEGDNIPEIDEIVEPGVDLGPEFKVFSSKNIPSADQTPGDLSSSLDEFNSEEISIILEAANYAMQYRYDGLADHLDLCDEFLRPLVKKYHDHLMNQ